jgi:hypothetical protein
VGIVAAIFDDVDELGLLEEPLPDELGPLDGPLLVDDPEPLALLPP